MRQKPAAKNINGDRFAPLARLVRVARQEAGLSLAQVAEACDCSVQFISNIEHGRAALPWKRIQTLAQTLKIPLEQLQSVNLAVKSKAPTSNSTHPRLRRHRRADLTMVLDEYLKAPAAVQEKFIQEGLKILQSRSSRMKLKGVSASK